MKRTSITLKCRLPGDIYASRGMRLEADENENLTARDCSLFERKSQLMRR